MLRIACVDNEKEQTDTLTSYLERYGADTGIALEIFAFHGGWAFLESRKTFDIVFLDIDMPDLDGMSTAKELRAVDDKCLIIFVTNWAQYAINGYEVRAFDFLVKPVNYNQFSMKFRNAVAAAERNRQDEIIVTESYGKRRLSIREIYYVETDKHKLVYHTNGGNIETWGAIKDVAKRLEPFGFALCNSGFLVNLQYVEKTRGYSVWVKGDELKISRNRQKQFLDALTSY